MRIIAAGNTFYGDDGVGAAVLDAIRDGSILPGAELVDIQTDALALVEHLDPDEPTVIIDAAQMGLAPGEVKAFRPDEAILRMTGDHLSAHGLGLAEAFALAERLGRMPRRLVIVGVEPARVAINHGLSAEVRAAVPRVIDIITAEVRCDG
jgi:hydrogenase maturation protease